MINEKDGAERGVRMNMIIFNQHDLEEKGYRIVVLAENNISVKMDDDIKMNADYYYKILSAWCVADNNLKNIVM